MPFLQVSGDRNGPFFPLFAKGIVKKYAEILESSAKNFFNKFKENENKWVENFPEK